MKIDVISDIHIDFWIKDIEYSDYTRKKIQGFIQKLFVNEPAEVLMIAGDIGHYNSQNQILFEEFKKLYNEVFYVHGNHEMYLVSNRQKSKYSGSFVKIQETKEICKNVGVHYLDGNVVNYSGIKFGGLPGWYNIDTPEKFKLWRNYTNDSRLIYSGAEVLGPHSYSSRIEANWNTHEFYLEQEKLLKNLGKCDVLMTHVAQVIAPDDQMLHEYIGDKSNIMYYVDNKALVKDTGCKLYVYGHTHNDQEYMMGDLQVVCNPVGYPHEANHTKMKTIEIKERNEGRK